MGFSVHSATRSVFQSSPGPKAECYPAFQDRHQGTEQVSILTRPEGRVLREVQSRPRMTALGFQSSPGPKAECYV